MAFGRIRDNTHKENADINMVPLIDIMLVLLVIFIITAPMVTQNVDLSLPKTTELPQQKSDIKPSVIEINADKVLFIEGKEVAMDGLSDALLALKTKEPNNPPIIQLNIDKTVPYEYIAELLAELSKAGLPNIGFATEKK